MRTAFESGGGLVPSRVYHPQLNDKGEKVRIDAPSTPTPIDEFGDLYMVATVVPGGEVPRELSGVPFTPWNDHPRTDEEWANVPGQLALNEPAMTVPKGKKSASGVIIEEADRRFWVVHPTNGFGGYSTTFPKGTIEAGMSQQANAIKEAFEESGLKVEITGFVGDVVRTTSVARYYMARRVGGSPADMGWESQAVSLVPRDEIEEFLNAKVDRDLISSLLEK